MEVLLQGQRSRPATRHVLLSYGTFLNTGVSHRVSLEAGNRYLTQSVVKNEDILNASHAYLPVS